MKKIVLTLLLVMSLGTSVFAATLSPMPPSAVGTYNDFGNQIRLDIYVKNTNATQYKIYWAPGYKATRGFKSEYIPATVSYIDRQNQQADRTGLVVPSQGWWTIEVVSVGSDGRTSKPFITNVDVLR